MMPVIVAALLCTAFALIHRFSRLHVIKYHVSGRSHASIRRRPPDEVRSSALPRYSTHTVRT